MSDQKPNPFVAKAQKLQQEKQTETPAVVDTPKVEETTQTTTPAPEEAITEETTTTESTPAETPKETPKSETNVAPFQFMTGQAAAKAEQAEEAARESRQKEAFKFRIGDKERGQDFHITFLDGEMREERLDTVAYHKHNFKMNGQFQSMLCLAVMGRDCPLCQHPSIKSANMHWGATIIRHDPYTTKDGKVIPWRKQLFEFKTSTRTLLTKLAESCGGSLVNKTFSVSRDDSKTSPAVGTMFIPMADDAVMAHPVIGKNLLSLTEEDLLPLVYEEAIAVPTDEEIRKILPDGGATVVNPGTEGAPGKSDVF